MPPDPVIVVGATPDYVVKIHSRYADTAVFLMRKRFQEDPLLAGIPEAALIFAPFADFTKLLHTTRRFLSSNAIQPGAIACFDCEALLTAATLAAALKLRFPPAAAIGSARNKFAAKQIWRQNGVHTPAGILADDLEQTLRFFRAVCGDIVLKPVSGSGSELVFFCRHENEVREAVAVLEKELARRRGNPLFEPLGKDQSRIDPCTAWIAEEFARGPEFSCDFILERGEARIIRATGKLKAHDQTCGAMLAYIFPASFPDSFSTRSLTAQLAAAAVSLGFDWGYFMADFIITDNQPVLLELTPRPGGDSIPDLVEAATGKDILKLYLDFTAGRLDAAEWNAISPQPSAAVNIFAPGEGIITHLDVSAVLEHPAVSDVVLRKSAGDMVRLPPSDYDNRLLGYGLLNTGGETDLAAIYEEIKDRLRISLLSPEPETQDEHAWA